MQLAAHYTWHVTESNGRSSLWPGLAFSANKLLCEMHFREFSLGEKDIFPSLYGLHRIVSIVTKAIVQLLSLWNRFLNVHLMCEEKKKTTPAGLKILTGTSGYVLCVGKGHRQRPAMAAPRASCWYQTGSKCLALDDLIMARPERVFTTFFSLCGKLADNTHYLKDKKWQIKVTKDTVVWYELET